MILAQLSDPHLSVRDWAAADAFALAVRAVLGLRPVPDAVLVSGDIADTADVREYARARELVGRLPMPVHLLAGNVDDRDRLRDAFGGPPGPRRYVAEVAGVRLLACDTSVPGAHGGALGSDGLAWLAAELAAAPDTPTILALHHPPLAIGIEAFDAIGLAAADAVALAEILAGAPQVVRIVSGHVHRAVFATLGTIPFAACPSTYLQSRLELGDGPLELVPAPPAMLVHVWRDGRMISHVQPI
jgi:Icc protein